MSRIPVKLKLVESTSKINNLILDAIYKNVGKAIDNSAVPCKYRIITLVGDRIRKSPEYGSLINGQLQGEFGLDNSTSRVESILNIWLNSIQLIQQPILIKSTKLVGGFKLQIIDESFKDVINTPSAIINTHNGQIPWLEWLLLAGDAILVGNYHSSFSISTFSRSGQAVMLPGGSWRVPSQFSGIKGNNWVTRALFGIEVEIAKIITEEVTSRI